MDPVIISAIIAAVSAIISALISGVVAIKVKEIEIKAKDKNVGAENKLSKSDKKSAFWKWGLIGAFIGVAITLIALKSIDLFPTPETITSLTPDVLQSNTLFTENFEDGYADGITYDGNKSVWSVIKDETDNFVLDGDNSNKIDLYPRIIWGDQAWKDYELSLRIRFINQPPQWTAGIIYFRSSPTYRSYQIDLNPYNDDITLNFDGSSYSTLTRTSFIFVLNKWYLITIRADGENLLLEIDNRWVLEKKDANRNNGNLNLVPEAGVHLQVDDIVVTAIQ